MKSRLLWTGVIVGLVGLLTTGCMKKSVVGKWSGSLSMPGAIGPSVNAILEYKPDGTETITINEAGRTFVANGKYTVKDDTLMETMSSISTRGRTYSMPPQSSKAKSTHFKLDGDNLILSTPGVSQSLTLTRVKS